MINIQGIKPVLKRKKVDLEHSFYLSYQRKKKTGSNYFVFLFFSLVRLFESPHVVTMVTASQQS